VPRKIDLAIIAVPAKIVPDVVRECGEAGVSGAVIVSSGFKEIGAVGKKLEDQVVSIAEPYGLRLLGPNCLGYVRPARNLNATFAHVMPEAGRVAFISQSGALGTAVLDWATANEVGFSAFVSVGSMCDVDFGDLIDYFGADPQTNSIILYIESLPDARKFMSAARHFAKTKPIIVVKSGRTARSALAAASHTGAIAGDDTLYSAAFRRAGVVRVEEIEDLFDASEALSRVSSPRGPKLGIVTNAGGPGVMASDRLLALGGELAELAPETDARLKECLPSFAARGNPVDVGGDADAERYAAAAAALMDDPNCDGVLAILTPQAMSYPTQTAEALIEVAKRHVRKPLLTSFMGEIKVADGIRLLRTAHVPTFDTPETRCAPTCTCTSTPRASRPSTRRRPTSCRSSPPTATASRRSSSRSRARSARRSARSRPRTCSRPTASRSSRPCSPPAPKSAPSQGRGDRLSGGRQDPLARHHPQVRRGRHRAERALRRRGRQAVQQDHRARAEAPSPRPSSWA
jgi:acetyltransferase